MKTIKAKIANRHNLNIDVLIEQPAHPTGLLFLLHGFMSFKEAKHIQVLADTGLDNQLTVIRFDTTHSFGQSGGTPGLSTITSFVEDLSDVIAWAKTQPWYQEPFILAGHSLGGIAILEYAHQHPEQVKALAPIATVVSGDLSLQAYQTRDPEALASWQRTGYEVNANQDLPGSTAQIPYSHQEDRFLYNALSYADRMEQPVFFHVGTLDPHCPPAHQQLLFDAWGSDRKELHIIEGARHTYRDDNNLAVLQAHFSIWLQKL